MWRIFLTIILSIGLVSIFSVCLAQEMHEHHMMAEEHHAMEEETQDLGICPVMQGKASKEYSYSYEGKTYYFCCPGCIEEFKADPEKYMAKIPKKCIIKCPSCGTEIDVIQECKKLGYTCQ